MLSNRMSIFLAAYLTVWISNCFYSLSYKFTEEAEAKVFLYRVVPLTTRLFHIFRVYSVKLGMKLK